MLLRLSTQYKTLLLQGTSPKGAPPCGAPTVGCAMLAADLTHAGFSKGPTRLVVAGGTFTIFMVFEHVLYDVCDSSFRRFADMPNIYYLSKTGLYSLVFEPFVVKPEASFRYHVDVCIDYMHTTATFALCTEVRNMVTGFVTPCKFVRIEPSFEEVPHSVAFLLVTVSLRA